MSRFSSLFVSYIIFIFRINRSGIVQNADQPPSLLFTLHTPVLKTEFVKTLKFKGTCLAWRQYADYSLWCMSVPPVNSFRLILRTFLGWRSAKLAGKTVKTKVNHSQTVVNYRILTNFIWIIFFCVAFLFKTNFHNFLWNFLVKRKVERRQKLPHFSIFFWFFSPNFFC